MTNIFDRVLDRITMYRLVLYYLVVILIAAVIASFFGLIPYTPPSIVVSTVILLVVSIGTNYVFSWAYEAPVNLESSYITALILALIVSPAATTGEYMFLVAVAVLSMASKYIFAISKKHIFNPVVAAVVLTSFATGQSASWWVGNLTLLPIVALSGLLIVRKTRRDEMIMAFMAAAVVTTATMTFMRGGDVASVLDKLVYHSSLMFFAFAMLTEPLTTPATKMRQVGYGGLVGVLFYPQLHILGLYSTPELALAVGNILAFCISPREKLVLTLASRVQLSSDTYEFVFKLPQKVKYVAGQYMEWTLPHKQADSRGTRRYLTLSSAPEDPDIRIGVKFYERSSSFKEALLSMNEHTKIVASQLSGEFVMPSDTQPLVFVAGGIGITPFISMIRSIMSRSERRDITVFYSNAHVGEIAYGDLLDEARDKAGIKVINTITDRDHIPPDWRGESGRIDSAMIARHLSDYSNQRFYISGPQIMVRSVEAQLLKSGVSKSRIITDFFPGFV